MAIIENPENLNSKNINTASTIKPQASPMQQINTQSKNTNQTNTSSVQTPEPKKSKSWVWILIIIIIILLGIYLLFINKNLFNNLISGNNFNFTKTVTDVKGNFFYNSNLDGLIYQKADGKIYGDYYDVEENNYLTFNPLGAKFISLSSDGQKAVLYYQDEPVLPSQDTSEIANKSSEALLNAKGNFYLADLAKNEMFSIGSNLSSFMWGNDKLYMLRNGFEILDYDFRVANYTPALYQGPAEPYMKITDLNSTLYFADLLPGTDIMYLIEEKDGIRSLFSLDATNKQFTKIMDTRASSIMFSPSGKYYALFDNDNKSTIVYNKEDNTPIYTISNEVVMPMKIVWLFDEDMNESKLFYFSSTDNNNSYYGLNGYDLTTKTKITLFSAGDKKFADPANLDINPTKNLLYFSSDKNDNIYQLEVK